MGCCLLVCGYVVDSGWMYDRSLAEVLWTMCGSCVEGVVGKCMVELSGSFVDHGFAICICWVVLWMVYG